jgi:hypothetical protein
MIVIRLLHAILGALPGFTWWRNSFFALIKTLEVEGVGHTLAFSSWRRLAKRRHNSHPNGTPDVEKGEFPIEECFPETFAISSSGQRDHSF